MSVFSFLHRSSLTADSVFCFASSQLASRSSVPDQAVQGLMRISSLVLAASILFIPKLSAADTGTAPLVLPKGISQVTSVEGITEYRLPNGLKVLLIPDASKPTITVNMTYLVGSRHENYGETGMAHLLEHMMFKGTPGNPKITEEFNKRGMRMNGTTSLDRTNYYELFQASDDNLKWALQMEADRMVHSNIAKKDLDSEMTVVRNEFEGGENSPGAVMMKRMQSIAFDWHNYGNATIGNRSDIENVKIENLQAFYRQYYQPDNAVLLVAGKFDQHKTLEWIATDFGKIAKPARVLPTFWTVEPTQDGERNFVVRRKGDVQLVMVAYKIPANLHPDSDPLGFAGDILTDSPNGRLYKQLVETGKVIQVFSTDIGSVAPGLKVIGVLIKKDASIDAAKDALLAAIEDFKAHPPTKEEMDRVKRDTANTYEKILNNHESIGISMSEYIALGDWRYLFKDRDDSALVTAEQVNAAVKRYFVRDNRTIGLFIPEDVPQRAEITAAPSMADVMKDFKPKASSLTAEVFDSSPANIDQRTLHASIGGLQVALLPKKTRGETVNVSLNLHWGDEKSLFNKKTASTFTRGLLAAGTSKFTRAQLADEMAKLKITGNVFSFQTTKANLPAAIALMSSILRDPVFPEAEFNQLREKMIVGMDSSRNEPSTIANQALAQHFNQYPKGDIRAFETIDEAIASAKQLSLDQIKAYYQQFYGASKGELAIVGDMDVDSTKNAVSVAFADWKSAAPFNRLVDHQDAVPAVRLTFNTPDKENAYFISRMNLALRQDDVDYPALSLANYIFGAGSGLNSRLMDRIRQKDGLSYGGGSSLSAGDLDPVGSFSISATAAPQNLVKLEAAIKEELQRALSQGFTQEELSRAKSGLLQQRAQNRTGDGSIAGGWAYHLYMNRTWAWSQAMDDKIKAVTLDQMNAAFKKYIDPAKMSTFIAGDEAKAKAK